MVITETSTITEMQRGFMVTVGVRGFRGTEGFNYFNRMADSINGDWHYHGTFVEPGIVFHQFWFGVFEEAVQFRLGVH